MFTLANKSIGFAFYISFLPLPILSPLHIHWQIIYTSIMCTHTCLLITCLTLTLTLRNPNSLFAGESLKSLVSPPSTKDFMYVERTTSNSLTKFFPLSRRYDYLGFSPQRTFFLCAIVLLREKERELEFLSSIKRPNLTHGTRVYMCSWYMYPF